VLASCGERRLISLPKHLGTVSSQQHNGFDQCSKHTNPYITFGGQVQNRLALGSDMQKLGRDVLLNGLNALDTRLLGLDGVPFHLAE